MIFKVLVHGYQRGFQEELENRTVVYHLTNEAVAKIEGKRLMLRKPKGNR